MHNVCLHLYCFYCCSTSLMTHLFKIVLVFCILYITLYFAYILWTANEEQKDVSFTVYVTIQAFDLILLTVFGFVALVAW